MSTKQNGGRIAGSAEEHMCKLSRGVFQQLKQNNSSILNRIYRRITKYNQTLVLFYHFELASNEIAENNGFKNCTNG